MRLAGIQKLTLLDFPGKTAATVFTPGCNFRCPYCHNADLVAEGAANGPAGCDGQEPGIAPEDVLAFLDKRRGLLDGVCITGGEPLLQADFVAEFFEKLHEHGVHTALDTSGVGNLAQAEKVLEHTDLVLCDLKFLSKADYLKNCRADYGQIERFLQLTAMKGVPLWIRHVVVPGLTDSLDHLRRVKAKAESYPNFEKLEFLPFHKLCIEKYDRLGLEFPLRDTPAMTNERLSELLAQL